MTKSSENHQKKLTLSFKTNCKRFIRWM